MRVDIKVLGLKLLVEITGTHWAYVKTNWFEAFWSRHQWFEGRGGRDRHWCFDRVGKVG